MAKRGPLGETAIKSALPRLKQLGMIDFRRVKTRQGLRENKYEVLPGESWKWGYGHETTVAAAQSLDKTALSAGDPAERWSPRDRTDSRQATRNPKSRFLRQHPAAIAGDEERRRQATAAALAALTPEERTEFETSRKIEPGTPALELVHKAKRAVQQRCSDESQELAPVLAAQAAGARTTPR